MSDEAIRASEMRNALERAGVSFTNEGGFGGRRIPAKTNGFGDGTSCQL